MLVRVSVCLINCVFLCDIGLVCAEGLGLLTNVAQRGVRGHNESEQRYPTIHSLPGVQMSGFVFFHVCWLQIMWAEVVSLCKFAIQAIGYIISL